MKDVVEDLIDISGTTKSLVVDPARVRPSASEVDKLYGTSALLNSLTGWSPTYGGLQGFKQGLELRIVGSQIISIILLTPLLTLFK